MNAFPHFWLLICGIFFQGNSLPYGELSSKYDTHSDNQEVRLMFGPRASSALDDAQNNHDSLIDHLPWFPSNGLQKAWNSPPDQQDLNQAKQKGQMMIFSSGEDPPQCDTSKCSRMKQKIKMKLRNFSNNYNVPKTWSSIKSHSAESMCKVKTYIKNKRIKEKLKNITHPLRYKGPKCKPQTTKDQNYHLHPKSSHVEKIHSFTTPAPMENNDNSRDIILQNFPPIMQIPQMQYPQMQYPQMKVPNFERPPETSGNIPDSSTSTQTEELKPYPMQSQSQPQPQQEPEQSYDITNNFDLLQLAKMLPIFDTSSKSEPSATGSSASDPQSTGSSASDPQSTGSSASDPQSTGSSASDPQSTGSSASDSQSTNTSQSPENSEQPVHQQFPLPPEMSSAPNDLLTLSQQLLHPPKTIQPESQSSSNVPDSLQQLPLSPQLPSETPESPEPPQSPEPPESPESSQFPDPSEIPETSEASQFPDSSNLPASPDSPNEPYLSQEPYFNQNHPFDTKEQPQIPILSPGDSSDSQKILEVPNQPESSKPLGYISPPISQLLKPVPLPPELEQQLKSLPDLISQHQQSSVPLSPLPFPEPYKPVPEATETMQPVQPLPILSNLKPFLRYSTLSRHHKPIYGTSMSMAPFPRRSKLLSSSSFLPFAPRKSFLKSAPSTVFLQFSDQSLTKPLHFLLPYQKYSDSIDTYPRHSPDPVDSTAYMLFPDAPHSHLYSPRKIKLIINFNNAEEKSKFERNADPDLYLASLEGDSNNSTHVLETAGEMASDLAGRVTNLWHCVLGSHRVPDTRDVRFFLYTRRNVVQPELLNVNYDLINKRVQAKPERYDIDCVDVSPDQIEDFQRISDENREIIKSNHLNIRAPTKILIHGYTGSYKDSRMAKIKDAYLSKGRYNVIQVDWEVLAAPPCYIRVTHHSKFVGETIAQLLNGLYMVGLNMSLVHLIGFSLGAQVAGFTGNNSTVVPVCRITGLDPALPLFLHTQPSGHLDKLDAKFVDVIHTCGGILAMLDPLGHVDFYPNGGTRQPGCEFSNLKCSHSRAPQYFAESVNSVKKFTGQLCLTWEEFVAGDCKNTSAYMGEPCSRK